MVELESMMEFWKRQLVEDAIHSANNGVIFHTTVRKLLVVNMARWMRNLDLRRWFRLLDSKIAR